MPDSATVLVPAPLPPTTFTYPVFAPALVGLNTTLIVQPAPTAKPIREHRAYDGVPYTWTIVPAACRRARRWCGCWHEAVRSTSPLII